MKNEQSSSKSQFQINKTYSYQPCFEENANILSRIFFIWSHEIIRRGNEKHLDMEDLSDLRKTEQPREDYNNFSSIFYQLANLKKNRLIKGFFKYIGPAFLLAGLLAAISNLLQFSGPLMIGKILAFLNSSDQINPEPTVNGVMYVTVLIGCYLLRTVIFGHSMHFLNLSCTKVLNSSNSLIYSKILNLSSSSRKYLDVGSIMTHINVDVMAFYYFIMMSSFLFSAPLMILTAVVLLILQVGWIGLIAPLMFAIGMYFQNIITTKAFQLRKDQLFWTDKRTKCVNEYFSGIRIIKYYGWQKLVAEKIDDIRTEQMKLGFKSLLYRTYIQVIMNMLPIFASIIIFGVYSALNGQDSLTSSKVYTVLSIFNLIATPMRLVVMTIINFMNARASLQRINHFLGYEERSFQGINSNDQDLQVGDIELKNCLFQWESQEVKKHNKEGQVLKQRSKNAKKDQKKEPEKKQPQKKAEKKKKKKKKDEEEPKKKKKKSKKNLISDNNLNESLLSQQQRKSLSTSSVVSSSSSAVVENLQINNLRIHRGQFVSVIGRVGSGKTTFLYSILGEIDKKKGSLSRRGSIAYIPQVSWLRSTTIRNNILFENPFDQSKYNHIVKICELTADLQMLPGGDMTQIGEKGVNLSGGQKQRISIARALYANADIYLIDDCLSALDPYVGKSIFYNCLKQHLHDKGKTIILVTNAIHFTEETDRVIVMDKGRIIEDDIPLSLQNKRLDIITNLKLQAKKTQQAEESKKQETQRKKSEEQLKKKEEDDMQLKLDEEQITEDTKKEKQVVGLVKVEQRLKGSVPWIFYYRFFTGPGGFKAILMFVFITLAQFARVFSDWWLGEWGSDSLQMPSNDYIIVYACISVVVAILIYFKGLFFAKFIVATSRVIQRQLIQTLIKTPLSWFDVTPTGRIISRTTKDQDDLDNSLSFNVQFASQNLLILFCSIIIISIATPLYLIVAGLSGLAYYKMIGLYMNSSREIKRLQANSRAPLIGHISQTINGTYVIRAFDKIEIFRDQFFIKQKDYIVCITNQNICTRWISIITDIFSIITIAATGYFGVLSSQMGIPKTSNNIIGLALVWSLQINSIMSFTLRVLADTESNMNSVVRLYDYIDNNPCQKSFEQNAPVHSEWPTEGVVSVKNASYKYRPELNLVLKNLSFDIAARSKIGVVGRTGCGKSTLTLGLLRILELAQNEDKTVGKIIIDDENTSQLGLHSVRHNVTIIPQDPTLFTGTLKSNIDPFNKYSDEEIAQTLKKVQIWDQIREEQSQTTEVRRKVYTKIDDSGSNFSLGQKQLICMARALIRKPKVLLMDQATASIDEKTDELIQKMIRTQFNETTVITIAHRLNTIIYYDKILVLEKGEIKEYDEPLKLVRDEKSFLGKLIRKTGQSYMRKIIALAENKASSIE